MMFIWLIISIVFYLTYKSAGRPDSRIPATTESDHITDILLERFAHGEINREEYLHMQKTLNNTV